MSGKKVFKFDKRTFKIKLNNYDFREKITQPQTAERFWVFTFSFGQRVYALFYCLNLET